MTGSPDAPARRPDLSRVQQDLAAGRPWKARDRLKGLLGEFPTDQGVLVMLGEAYYRMGDLPEAGRYWFLTEHEGVERVAAEAAFRERVGGDAVPHRLLLHLPARESVDAYPCSVRERLRALQAQATAAGVEWSPRAVIRREARPRAQPLTGGGVGAAIIGIGCVGIFLLGLVAAGYLVWRLVDSL